MQKLRARSLEVGLTEHCNLRCYACDHAAPLLPARFLEPAELQRDLDALRPVYEAFEFKLVGGEPLLHPELLDVCARVRASGIATQLTLVTNGVLLHRMPEEVWTAIDKLWVSAYPGAEPRQSEEETRELARRHGVRLKYRRVEEFRLTLLNDANEDAELVRAVFDACAMRHHCHALHDGRYHLCSPSPFLARRADPRGERAESRADSVALRDNPRLREELDLLLRRSAPLDACRHCLGSVGVAVPSRQMDAAALRAWRAEDHPDPRSLVDYELLRARGGELGG